MTGWVFDLDDTLYLERDYVASGFRAVARAIAVAGTMPEDDVYTFLRSGFEAGVRGRAFDRLRDESTAVARRFETSDLVEVYRVHEPSIRPLPGAVALLDRATAAGVPLALVTDGEPEGQGRKLTALGLDARFSPAVRTGTWGRAYWKPHPRAFETVEAEWRARGADLVYVADNPAKDFVEPRRRGWRTVRLRLDGQLHAAAEASTPAHAAEHVVHSVDALAAWLERTIDE